MLVVHAVPDHAGDVIAVILLEVEFAFQAFGEFTDSASARWESSEPSPAIASIVVEAAAPEGLREQAW